MSNYQTNTVSIAQKRRSFSELSPQPQVPNSV